MYGLMLLLAIAASLALTGWRWVRWGGDWDLVFRVTVWGVAFGIVGARAYHDLTSWSEVPDKWWGPFAVWEGGLGVWGGILLGCLIGAWIVHRSGQSVRLFLDAVAPGLLLAQGIGRWGNWFNQELFALYVSYYTVGRFFEELLRIDPAHKYGPLRLNAWVSAALFVLSTAFFIWWQFIRRETGRDRPRATPVPKGPAMAVPKGRVRTGR